MPAYLFRCPKGHTATLVQSIHDDLPPEVCCPAGCQAPASRVFEAPGAIHFKGTGFYATDVKGRLERKRRPNAGDRLAPQHDPDAEAIARHI